MNETINLMRNHKSVRSFTQEPISDAVLRQIIDAGRSASSWKNFQSYSIIKITDQALKEKIYDLVPQPAILQSQAFLLFVGDINRASKAVSLHTSEFYSAGIENLLITSVDAALAGQNTLLAAESLGYGGVMIGLVRYFSKEIADLLKLPDYTYPLFALALGRSAEDNPVKPRLPHEHVVFENAYVEQDFATILAYDQVQADYAGARQPLSFSQRMAEQFGKPEVTSSSELLQDKKLLD